MPVPPVATIVTVAVPPLHKIGEVTLALETEIAVGPVIVALAVAVHPLASVTVTVYTPAAKPLKS